MQKYQLAWEWILDDKSVVFGMTNGFKFCKKIAMFDMDGTLINFAKATPKNPHGFTYLTSFDNLQEKLKNLSQDGYSLVIISNQHGIALGQTTDKKMTQKVEEWSLPLGVELACVMAKLKDQNRKPETGMYDYAHLLSALALKREVMPDLTINQLMELDTSEEKLLVANEINLKDCFYVGDAAGRPKSKNRRYKDHSDCDKGFALNLGVKFYTPEKYFFDKDE